MKIFLSWSGDRSHDVAIKLRTWLRDVIQAADPWMSKEDISPGAIWFGEISDNIIESKYGILCVTGENREKPWLLWEAGALYRGFEDPRRVVPFVIDIEKNELDQPLSNFQVVSATDKQDVLRMLKGINSELPRPISNESLEKQLNLWWDNLQTAISKAMSDNPVIATPQSTCKYKFTEAADKFLKEPGKQKSSTTRDEYALRVPRAYFGDLPLDRINDDALRTFKADRLAGTITFSIEGKRPNAARTSTLNKELRTVGAVLNRAADEWNWIEYAPKISRVPEQSSRKPYILDRQAEANIFAALPDHVRPAALFGINTGVRRQIISDLEWSWQKRIPEIESPIFVVPRGYRGSKFARPIMLNSVAARVVDAQRGTDSKFVFIGKKGIPFYFGKTWQTAWTKVGLPSSDSYKKGVENLRLTFEHRLIKAGVNSDDRNALLWVVDALRLQETNPPNYKHLLACVEKIVDVESDQV